ncbi:MAG: metallochaperone AztD [Aquamicrobium sp.]|nr:metallochaperone AztD [Aquamicrobium sp.]
MKSISRWTWLVLAAGVAAASVAGNAKADEDSHWRLFVGDHTDPIVRAIELDDGKEAGRFDLDSYASLYRSKSGRTVFAVQGEAGKVAIFRSGIAVEDHGEHVDLDIDDPERLETGFSGEKPAHFFENGGRIAMFYDGEGRADIFPEGQVLDGKFSPLTLDVGAPHHGLAASFGDYVIHSVPDPEDASRRPVALRIKDFSDNQVGEDVACPGLHGQAGSGGVLAFGCHDGIVVAMSAGSAAPELRHVSTAELGEGNVSTLRGGTALQFFLTNYGQSAVVLVEPGAETTFRKVDLPMRRVDFAVDPAKTRNTYILTEDGKLHLLDVLSGKIEKSLQLTEPYSMDGHWRDPRPRLAVAGDYLAVTDPLKGVIRLVDTDRFAEERTIAVEGMPYTIVAVGGSGKQHD